MGQIFIACPEIVRSRGFEIALRGCELVAECRAVIERLRALRGSSARR